MPNSCGVNNPPKLAIAMKPAFIPTCVGRSGHTHTSNALYFTGISESKLSSTHNLTLQIVSKKE